MANVKTFVLRTKVTTSSPTSTQNFGDDNEVVIPMPVYERLNTTHISYERRSNAIGILNYVSSLVSDNLSSVAALHDVEKGLVQPNGSKLFILSPQSTIDEKIFALSGLEDYDRKIFQLCLELQKKGKDVRLISKNPVIREKAMLLGIHAEPFKDELAPALSEQYTGKGGTVLVSINTLEKMYDSEGNGISMDELLEEPTVDIYENMFFRVSTRENESVKGKQYVLGRYSKGRILPLKYYKTVLPDGFIAKNDDQKMMMECLLAPASIAPFVVIKGSAGAGKTFGAVSSALSNLDQYNDNDPKNIGHYNTFLVSAPIVDMTKEKLGHLPGSMEEKAGPYLGGFTDNIKNYFRIKTPEATNCNIVDSVSELFDRKFVEITPANYLRGRSITNSFFMLDEAQNYDPSIILDITTRGGEGTKIILMGDPTQINNPDLNVRHNGVVYGSESMKGDPLCWQITLERSVRSPLAQAAIRRMRK